MSEVTQKRQLAAIMFTDQSPDNLLAMEIHLALQHLGEITGEITTDEIPSRMCSTFCLPDSRRVLESTVRFHRNNAC
jgi:tRNA U34 5-carboxymethylaminomethyl modifying GTPase MnmE/TrmE